MTLIQQILSHTPFEAKVTLEGEVERVAFQVVLQSDKQKAPKVAQVIKFMLCGDANRYSIDVGVEAEAAWLKAGDRVRFQWQERQGRISGFTNLSLQAGP